jgi:hypothetical protein
LLQHVSNPPGRSRDENAERKRSYFIPCFLIADELVPDLRPVAVDDYDAPSVESEIDNGSQARPGMTELVGDR